MTFENKTVLITGASGGLAFAFIKALLNQNTKKIYCTARDITKLESIKNISEKIEILPLDITNKNQIKEVALKLENIDILINNAGVNSGKKVLEEEKMDFEVNLFGTLNSCQILGKKINKGGAIINISSILALMNLPVMALYCASKSALHSLTQALRAQLSNESITVFEVLPGPIDTNMTKGQDMPKTSPEKIVSNVLAAVKKDEYEIYPDDFSKMVIKRLKEDKETLEKEFAMSVKQA